MTAAKTRNTAGLLSSTYNAFNRNILVDTVINDAYRLEIFYGSDQQRWKTELKKNNTVTKKIIFAGNYEEVTENGVTQKMIYLPGGGIHIKQAGQSDKIYYTHKDHLGSIVKITDNAGTTVFAANYDAWGKQTVTTSTFKFHRGYTGHEHLSEFGIINMNARLYDPIIGRALSPDPYVQAPDFSQNYNRYTYCLNNPMIHTDQSGEFIVGFIAGFIKGIVKWENPLKHAWQSGVNEMKIYGGLFAADTKQSGWGWQIVSRFTWELPQTILGLTFAQTSNYAGQVDRVDYWGGATVTSGNNWGKMAVTLGSYIVGNRDIAADPNNALFQHEYGHMLQSRVMGLAYLPRVGISSLLSDAKTHMYQPFEQDANKRAFMYFNENVEGFYQTEDEYRANLAAGIARGWNFRENPLDVNKAGKASKNVYYDYQNPEHRALISSLSISAKWYDYAGWLGGFPSMSAVGLGNGLYYRNNRIK